MTCQHVEHRHDRATDRRIGLDWRLNEWQPCPADRGMTTGQLDRFRAYLLQEAAKCDGLADEAGGGSYSQFYRGQAAAFRSAELSVKVAAVGALPLDDDPGFPGSRPPT